MALRFSDGIRSRSRNLWFRALGVQIEGYVWMRQVEIPRLWSCIRLEHHVALDRGVTLLCSGESQANKLVIRAGTYVNRYTVFDAHQRIDVGRDCMIGPHCYITDGDHGTARQVPIKEQPMKCSATVIEDEVWLGAHVTVLAGVTVGRGAIIGAGAVVTKNIPAWTIAMGVPARPNRERE